MAGLVTDITRSRAIAFFLVMVFGDPQGSLRSPWGLATVRGQAPELRLWGPVGPKAADALAVRRVRDIAYDARPAAHPMRHRLDLYLPEGKDAFPVLVLVHGGAWTVGDNRCLGLYTTVGEFLASRGIGVVMPNYRLSPGVRHPEHVKDLARALAWTKANIAKHGGNPKSLFLAGHSAGGHLAALLATDESYAKAEGLNAGDVRGVIALSGVYRIPDFAESPAATNGPGFHPDQVLPLRGEFGKLKTGQAAISTRPLDMKVYEAAFGADAKVRSQASPVNHVRADLPPFLLLTAEKDLPGLDAMADEFHRALAAKGNRAEFMRVAGRNHSSIMFNAVQVEDPVARAMITFIEKNAR